MNAYSIDIEKHAVSLFSPTALPNACGFLWNTEMMIQMNCRGYAQAQHMQPEPTKYAQGPALEAKTFMQPEHSYYAHHPGRFFYIKEKGKPLFSLPYEPVRQPLDRFEFIHQQDAIVWQIEKEGLAFELTLTLAESDPIERWGMRIENKSGRSRCIDVVPYFPIGYLSWMNQSASFSESVNGIVAHHVPPYQKTEDWPAIKRLKTRTVLLADTDVTSWTSRHQSFEGEGGLHNPDALTASCLPGHSAQYERPAAVLQHKTDLPVAKEIALQWLFGPVDDEVHAAGLAKKYFTQPSPNELPEQNTVKVISPDAEFGEFISYWLPRQMRYHGEVNRLTTDPQTRNFLQDQMGMVYLNPEKAKQAFLFALQQQSEEGALPDGILLHQNASLNYINQIPHTDHNVWIITFLSAYLRETADFDILTHSIPFNSGRIATVLHHVELAMVHLYQNLDHRGLSLILQGDWCDPMNHVGKNGKGVSAWLTMATSYCFQQWHQIRQQAKIETSEVCWLTRSELLNEKINQFFWKEPWYARGITDCGRTFGVKDDIEGAMYLNPQSWAMLCGAMDKPTQKSVIAHVDKELQTPYGPALLAPAYTEMDEDIGRITQKFPGAAENGAVYNHAAAFYAFALYQQGEADKAFEVLKKMLPQQSDVLRRGQLPVYIPNYYRGAFHQFPDHAGRSSHLFNTGTLPWYYQCVVEGMLGLVGCPEGLKVAPNLPSAWDRCRVVRQFRGRTYKVTYVRERGDVLLVNADGATVTADSVLVAPIKDTIDVLVSLPWHTGESR